MILQKLHIQVAVWKQPRMVEQLPRWDRSRPLFFTFAGRAADS